MTQAPPILDDRDRSAILAEMRRRLPGYVPRLKPAPGGAGYAWLDLVARQLDVLRQGVNGLPERNRLSFLELFGNGQLPSQSARAPLTFTLLETAQQDVTLPARSQVAAKVPPPPPSVLSKNAGEPPPAPVFFTDTTVTLTRGKLAAIYAVDPASDAFADHTDNGTTGFRLFEPAAPMPHRLYVGHDDFLKLAGPSEVTLEFDFGGTVTSAAYRPMLLDWSYLSQNGWLPLKVAADTTRRFTETGTVRLLKDFGPDAKQETIGGRKSYWIRAEVSTRRPRSRIVGVNGPTELSLAEVGDFLAGDIVTIDGSSRSRIVSMTGNTLALSRPLAGLTPPDMLRLLDQSSGPRTRIVGSTDDRVLIVEDVTGFPVGELVTVDGISSSRIELVIGNTIYLATALGGRAPQDILTLADSLPPLRPEGTDAEGALPKLDMIRLKVGFSKTGLKPDVLVSDTGTPDGENVFQPFGPQPELFSTLYIAGDDVFSRATANVQLNVTVPAGVPAIAPLPILRYEFYDGDRWLPFKASDEFFDETNSLTRGGIVGFIAPASWQKAMVNGEERFWLRVRIVSGDYGKPMKLSVVPDGGTYKVTAVDATLAPPSIQGLRLSYTYFTQPALPGHVLAENDLTLVDCSEKARWPNDFFEPFQPVGDRLPALHLGFTHKLPTGLISLFMASADLGGETPEPSPFRWEYFGEHGWTELAVVDETDGFRVNGTIQFVGPADAVPRSGLHGDLYWLRARLKAEQLLPLRNIAGLWANTLWGLQGESVQNDTLGISTGEADQIFALPVLRVPVLPGETIEVREWSGRGDAWKETLQWLDPALLRFDTDPATNEVTGVWVRWQERPHLWASHPADRHYLIERTHGTVRFGGPPNGKIPPAGARIRATYTVGGSVAGNVAADTITELRTGAGYVQSVTNPLAARGGTSVELLRVAGQRAPQRFRHRGRAMAPEDYEWLAREATPEVVRARCLATTGDSGRIQRGEVTLVIVPWSLEAQPQPDAELISRVRDYLDQRLPAGLADGLRIVGSRYAALSVKAEITPEERDGAAAVEARVREMLDAWLHPLTGGPDGLGWDYGSTIYLSTVTRMIEETVGVDHAGWIRLEIDGALAGDAIRIPSDMLVSSGEHQLRLKVGGLGNAA